MIAIGCDHGGVQLKTCIKQYLEENNFAYEDVGVVSADTPADYPDIAALVANKVCDGSCSCGILICGTGIGMSIAANKVKGIRAAHVTDTFSARMAKEHNNAQIICLGERITGPGLAVDLVAEYLHAEFQGGRHTGRVDKITALEQA